MLNKKVVKHMEHVQMYIHNRIFVGTSVEDVTHEVINRFKVELAFFDTTPEMIENFVELLCMQSFRYINNRLQNEHPDNG